MHPKRGPKVIMLLNWAPGRRRGQERLRRRRREGEGGMSQEEASEGRGRVGGQAGTPRLLAEGRRAHRAAGLDEVRRRHRRPPEQGRGQEPLPHRRRGLCSQGLNSIEFQ